MKALIVVNLAGFLNFLWNDVEILQSMGYTVSVAMNEKMADGSDAVELATLDAMGITHYHVGFDTKSPISKMNLVAYQQLVNILRKQYDFIHCHTPIAGLLTRLAASKYRRKGSKVLYTTHGFTFSDRSSMKTWLVFFNIEKFASRFCDAIITINQEDFKNAKKMHCRNVYLISGVGVDIARFQNVEIDRQEYRKQFQVNDDKIMVLAVGELSERKNHQIIIKALGRIEQKEKYVFVVCGRAVVNSDMEQKLIQLAEKYGVNLYLAGHRLDIPQINKCADIAVIPSLREGLGMAGLEALASGIPVVGADVQGIREYVIPNRTGFLCDPNSPEEFAEAIEKIASMSEDRREVMAEECRKVAWKYDKSVSNEQIEYIYRQVMRK